MPPPDFVKMRHPKTGGVAFSHPDAFEHTWKAKGWELVDETPKRRRTRRRPTADEADTALATDESKSGSSAIDTPEG